ncbi:MULTISPECIES: hypothetical protein [Streptomyces]|nr:MULTISPECIES: hypothetical protein [Streptomyces]
MPARRSAAASASRACTASRIFAAPAGVLPSVQPRSSAEAADAAEAACSW